MTTDYASHLSTFEIDRWGRLERFLILGNEGGTYYASERELTRENARCLLDCASEDAERTVRTVVDISQSRRAPKNDPAIFALALLAAHSEPSVRRRSLDELSNVCRTGTHLFQFVDAVTKFRGWGRGLRCAVASWYTEKSPDNLAYQVTKYQQRNGWSHRDVLRLCHADAPNLKEVIKYAAKKDIGDSPNTPLLRGVELVKRADTADQVIRLIDEYGLVREHIPTKWLNTIEVWEAMLPDMPMTALIRNLGKMTSLGVNTQAVPDMIEGARNIHPLTILTALQTYRQGYGVKGALTWNPVSRIVDALDAAFYKAFGDVEPANKRTLVGLDVSGSMACGHIAGSCLTPREASAALCMIQHKTEPMLQLMAFCHEFVELDISCYSNLETVIDKVSYLPFGMTDCSLPMIYALENNIEVDTFIVYTDNESWYGDITPDQALQNYRSETGIPAKLVVVGMTATGCSIADPDDAGMLDVVGFDTASPNIINDFSR